MTLQHVSLFSGVGGFDLAAERAGITPSAMCEIDPAAAGVLAHHWPNVPLFRDVKEVTGERLIKLGINPRRTVLTGGFPCQDLSVAGRGAGLMGARSGLFWEIVRILGEFHPQYFVLENVPGLLSSNSGRDMGTVVGALAERGYGVAWRLLNAQYFGVAQRRRRVFIVGCLGDNGDTSGEVLDLLQGRFGDPRAGEPAGQDTATATTGSVDHGSPVNARIKTGRGGGWSRRQHGSGGSPRTVAATLNSGGNSGGFRTEPGEHLVIWPGGQRG